MGKIIRLMMAGFFALTLAQPAAVAAAPRAYTQPELDQMLAPIALYPDALLSQILLAATRPHEVAQAARWSREHADARGEDAVRLAQPWGWDPNVTALLAFPELLARMAEQPEWTRALGEAFYVQEPVVMDTIQELRRRAQAAGQLLPDERYRVINEGASIVIAPSDARVMHLPYYDTRVVYGAWRWSTYPPVWWAPWPSWILYHRPAIGFWWGPPVRLSGGFFFTRFDWRHRHVTVHGYPHHHRHWQSAPQPAPQPRQVFATPVAPHRHPAVVPAPLPRVHAAPPPAVTGRHVVPQAAAPAPAPRHPARPMEQRQVARVEAQPQPRVAPQPQPRIEPRAEPRGERQAGREVRAERPAAREVRHSGRDPATVSPRRGAIP